MSTDLERVAKLARELAVLADEVGETVEGQSEPAKRVRTLAVSIGWEARKIAELAGEGSVGK